MVVVDLDIVVVLVAGILVLLVTVVLDVGVDVDKPVEDTAIAFELFEEVIIIVLVDGNIEELD